MQHLGWMLGSIGAAAGIFVLDWQTAVVIAVPVLYVLPILLVARQVPTPPTTIAAIAAALLLTWLGAVVSPGQLTTEALTNRFMTSALLLLVGGLLIQHKRLTQAEGRFNTVAARERLLLNVAPVMIYTCKTSDDYAATFVSENVVGLLGYHPRDFTERADFWMSHIHPDDRARVLADLSALSQTRRQTTEYRFRRKDGTYCWLHDEVQVLPHGDGRPKELIGFQIDITARKQTETALREREEQLRRLSAKLLEVQEEERRRLARELHDDFTQRLAALAIEIHGLSSAEAGAETRPPSRLAQLRKDVEDLARDLQQVAHQLHPSILEHAGLEAAVREHIDEFAARTGLRAETVMRDVPSGVPREHATCLYRILQESLQNVRKHANATTVLVRLLGTPHGLGLCIHDDGRGFEYTDHASRRGLGLTSMSERVALVKGTFRIRTKPGDGTEIHAWVPLPGLTDDPADVHRSA